MARSNYHFGGRGRAREESVVRILEYKGKVVMVRTKRPPSGHCAAGGQISEEDVIWLVLSLPGESTQVVSSRNEEEDSFSPDLFILSPTSDSLCQHLKEANWEENL